MKNSLLQQLKKRRTALGLKQHDMMLRVGMSRQQYQQLESKGNPRLSTLELVAKGLKGELLLIPQEKLDDVKAILENETKPNSNLNDKPFNDQKENELANDPWKNLLDDEDER